MKLNSAKRTIARRLKSSFKRWLLGSVIVFLAVLAVYAIILNQIGSCSATIFLKYDGVEAGVDPNGNRFDPEDFKNKEALRLTLEALGESAAEEDIQRVRDAVRIQGIISNEVLEDILEKTSVYDEDEVAEFHDVKISSHFPAQYEITFRYADAGWTAKQGVAFLNEFLKVCETNFYRRYGNNTALPQVIASLDYQNYDYIDSVDILDSHLTALRAYLSPLAGKDNTRFVSSTSAHSFTDLIDTIDTIRAEDIQWVTSYIITNNITKDRNQLMDYYQYKIEDAERVLTQEDARLYTLNSLIENYVKTTAIFPIIRDASSSQDTFSTAYEFSQPSSMYDTLINDKIACQTQLSETKERITMLQERVERLQAEEPSGNPELVEKRLALVNEQITRLTGYISDASDEFFKTVLLKGAVQVWSEPSVNIVPIMKTVRSSLPALLITESVLFGLYILSALRTPAQETAGKTREDEDETMKEEAPQ